MGALPHYFQGVTHRLHRLYKLLTGAALEDVQTVLGHPFLWS